ncbi:Gfo/Idh/MocA family oxidoreductase [Lewinella cohaerens]|jgi:predicted dehydrogenase|uniref:Gfo/Idh/MocA family oxidoreductase n=1 Tax=Lewinella cohaerens TaxID=70995 RepID=UPI0003650533|nr:Gfo/Idh/MocA family oxidoreductase [Lewinella cohaerens]
MQKSIAIIGAGELGSRHLQGVLKSELSFDVFVVEPSSEASKLAESRADEISHSHKVIFCTSIIQLPQTLDLVIIATNSNVRFTVLKQLLTQVKVQDLVLEKVLFQIEKEYYEALILIEEYEVRCYVNHPRRMQTFYQRLREELDNWPLNKVFFSAYGVNWGLGCNGLHLSDLMCYLLDDQIKAYNSEYLDPQIIASKRKGYVEFTGTLTGITAQGLRFHIHSMMPKDSEVLPISITIDTPTRRIFIQEGTTTTITTHTASNGFKPQFAEDVMLFQSDLSKMLVENALLEKPIDLPTYQESMPNHIAFTNALRTFYNTLNNTKEERCLIT